MYEDNPESVKLQVKVYFDYKLYMQLKAKVKKVE